MPSQEATIEHATEVAAAIKTYAFTAKANVQRPAASLSVELDGRATIPNRLEGTLSVDGHDLHVWSSPAGTFVQAANGTWMVSAGLAVSLPVPNLVRFLDHLTVSSLRPSQLPKAQWEVKGHVPADTLGSLPTGMPSGAAVAVMLEIDRHWHIVTLRISGIGSSGSKEFRFTAVVQYFRFNQTPAFADRPG